MLFKYNMPCQNLILFQPDLCLKKGDSNGTLVINGGLIIAVAHPGQDAGLDSENGTYINGGTILATGDMYDQISNESKQNFMVLNFQNAQTADTLISLLDEINNVVMSYKTDRSYKNLVYSSQDLKDGNYYLYKGGEIKGTETNGFFTKVESYTKGTQQGYSIEENQGGMGMQMPNGMPGERPSGDDSQKPDGMQGKMPSGENGQMPDRMPGEMPSGDKSQMQRGQRNDMQNTNSVASNKEFKISGIQNQFSGVADYVESSSNSEDTSNKEKDTTVATEALPQTGVISIAVAVIAIFVILAVITFKKNKKIKIK